MLGYQVSVDYLNFNYKSEIKRSKNFIEFISESKSLHKKFESLPQLNYSKEIERIQRDSTVKMTQLFDTQFVRFIENNRAEARTLRNIIKYNSLEWGFEGSTCHR